MAGEAAATVATRSLGRGAAVLATLAAGVLYGVAFPPLGLWWLAWLALAPFLVALHGASVRRTLGLGALWGVTAAYACGTWMPRAITLYYEQPLALGIAGFVACAALTVAPYSAAFALVHRRLAGRGGADAAIGGAAAPLLVAAAWTASELWRATSPVGNPWSLLGYSQYAERAVVQIADVAGVFGVSFVVAAVNAALAALWTRERQARGGAIVAGLLVAGVLAYGALRIGQIAAPPPSAGTVTIVQGNLDLGTQWRSEFYGANLNAYLTLTREALAQTPSRLVVWPEGTLTFFVEEEAGFRRAIGTTLAPFGTELLTGGPRALYQPGGATRYLNAAFLLKPDGEVGAVYEKENLLPFAEYFPLPQLDFLRRQFGKVREFTPGTLHGPLPTAVGAAGITICNEALYGPTVSARADAGAEYVVNLTNDTWGGEPAYAAIAFAMSTLRAVEQRRWLVRSSTSGPSAMIDPSGRLVAYAGWGERTTISAAIEPRRDRTPYARIGDAFGWLCTIVALGAAVRGRRGAG